MSKYIDADKFRDWLGKILLKDLSDGRGLCKIILAEDFEDAVKNMPENTIADVQEVKHGKWKAVYHITCGIRQRYEQCTCCKAELAEGDVYLFSKLPQDFNYCPNCGAKMDEEEELEQ